MREYDEKTLKRLQKVELEILKDFVKICDDNNLDYFGLAGTGIGVMRHKGFIPWDDDIDVGLPRKDYEEFLKIAEKELSDRYVIMNGRKNENYPLLTTRLMLKGTKFIEYALKDIDCELGIFLDIYPFDNISDKRKKYIMQGIKIFIFSKLLIIRSIPFPYIPYHGIKKVLIYCVTGFMHVLLSIMHISKKWLHKVCEKIMVESNGFESNNIAYLGDTFPYMSVMSMDDIYPLKKMKFEDIYIKMPNNLDKHLRDMYGNYMRMPPLEARKNHFPYKLEFEENRC